MKIERNASTSQQVAEILDKINSEVDLFGSAASKRFRDELVKHISADGVGDQTREFAIEGWKEYLQSEHPSTDTGNLTG